MTHADRLAEAVETRLPEIERELSALYDELDRGWDDGAESAVNELASALAIYRNRPPVDIDALVEDLLYEITPDHAVTPERRKRVRAVLHEYEGGGK